MPNPPFIIRATKRTPQSMKTADSMDVAARYFVYKLYEVTDGRTNRWQELRALGELPATIARAVERGWVVLDGAGSTLQGRSAVLTDEGRRLARRGR